LEKVDEESVQRTGLGGKEESRPDLEEKGWIVFLGVQEGPPPALLKKT